MKTQARYTKEEMRHAIVKSINEIKNPDTLLWLAQQLVDPNIKRRGDTFLLKDEEMHGHRSGLIADDWA